VPCAEACSSDLHFCRVHSEVLPYSNTSTYKRGAGLTWRMKIANSCVDHVPIVREEE